MALNGMLCGEFLLPWRTENDGKTISRLTVTINLTKQPIIFIITVINIIIIIVTIILY